MKSLVRPLVASCLLWCGLATTSILGQQPAAPPPNPTAAPQAKPEEGIPITSPVVQKACSACHALDDKQQMSRISFQRNTPEGWQENIRRMAALNGLKIDPGTAREVVKYLSDHLGLAPEEAKPAAFEVERRIDRLQLQGRTQTPRAPATSATRWAASSRSAARTTNGTC